MMSNRRSCGTFRRLSSNERLRATEPKVKKSKVTQSKNKPFEFAFISNSDESDQEEVTLRKDNILDRCIVTQVKKTMKMASEKS